MSTKYTKLTSYPRNLIPCMLSVLLVFTNCTNKKVETVSEGIVWSIQQEEVNGELFDVFKHDNHMWMCKNTSIEKDESWCQTQKTCLVKGRLYTWGSARTACTSLGTGWMLPSLDQWKSLATACGGYKDWFTEEIYGDPKKSNAILADSTLHPFRPQLNGWRGSNGGFDQQNRVGYYWSSTEQNEDQAMVLAIYPNGGSVQTRPMKKELGLSCRCIKKSDQ